MTRSPWAGRGKSQVDMYDVPETQILILRSPKLVSPKMCPRVVPSWPSPMTFSLDETAEYHRLPSHQPLEPNPAVPFQVRSTVS